jgi:hypothetical protein
MLAPTKRPGARPGLEGSTGRYASRLCVGTLLVVGTDIVLTGLGSTADLLLGAIEGAFGRGLHVL